MKKLLISSLIALSICSNAWATIHYFDNGSPDNTLPCTLADPCDNFPGTTLDNAGAISAGDSVLFKRGEIWEGTEANVIINSSGTAGNFITVGSYDTGDLPKFAGGAITADTWSNSSGSIYLKSGMSLAAVRAITTADDYGLMRWDGTNTNLPAGTYCWTTSTTGGTACTTSSSATNLYVRTYDDGTPASHGGIRVTSISLSAFAPLVGGSTTSEYVRYRDLHITNSPDRGFTAYDQNNEILNVKVTGARRDGIDLDDNSNSSWLYYPIAQYNATNGGGTGQGITIQSSNSGITGTGHATTRYEYEYNGQAGLDFLDYGPNNVSQNVTLRTKGRENGISPNASTSFDPNWYCDACSEHFAYGNVLYNAGKGLAAVAGIGKYGAQFGSEHPTTDPTENVQFINNLVFKNSTRAFYFLNTPQGTGVLPNNITMVYNTMVANEAGATNQVQFPRDAGSASNNIVMRNNVQVGNSGAYINWIITAGNFYTALDADNNLYYIRGQADTGTDLFDTNGGSGTKYNLAEWRTLSGEDANAVYDDPEFADESTDDLHQGATSGSIDIGMVDPYTIYSWVPQAIKDDIGSEGIKGSILTSGVADNPSTAPDAGFHYDYADITSTSAVPESTTTDSIGTLTMTFTIPQYVGAFLYDGTFKATLPTGWSWDDGASTAVTSSTITGTWTVAVVDQTATFTRVGDGNSEFYGTYNIVASNVGVGSSAGPSGTLAFYLTDADGNTVMQDTSVEGTTLVAPVQTTGGHFKSTGHFSCSRGFIS